MAVNNSIMKDENKEVAKTEYESNGEHVTLSPKIVRRFLVSGNGNVTDQEIMMFISLCKFQHLNPFLREAYLIKYGNAQPATMVVGKSVFMKRARRNPDFSGLKAGIILSDIETGQIDYREGTFYDSNCEVLVGGWAKVFIKGYECPFYASVQIDEYMGKKKDGTANSQWASKPATMIRKVAVAQALREAFPEESAGLYAPEEIPEATAQKLDETPIPVEEAEKKDDFGSQNVIDVEPIEEDVESVLFGGE